MLFDYMAGADDGLDGPPAYDVRSVFTQGSILPFDPAGITRSAISPGTIAALTQPPTAHSAQPIAALADGYFGGDVDLLDAYQAATAPAAANAVQLLAADGVELLGPWDQLKQLAPAGAAVGAGLVVGAIAGAVTRSTGKGAATGFLAAIAAAGVYRLVAGK